MNTALLLAEATEGGSEGALAGGIFGIVIYLVFFGGMIYFMFIRPQKKNDRARAEIMSSVEVGDSILTTSGFYGIVIDIQGDMVIVEFGNNKNCRIPMQKQAIVEVEKLEDK